ncbi:expressed unknown protein [Seminavis robusta]|uniref:Uncharacterized protein n=1 Tax=Seminavis robusta TaxID=568900 RepID=A0A9N8DSM8_9STRA|nr:expressed unknown protein [Seminavis robusta]|eukprot:Sro313_g114860.1 n/a (325) ;mRNA; f:46024-46998
MRHEGDTVVVMNLRQVVAAENNSANESIKEQSSNTANTPIPSSSQSAVVVDAIETMVLPSSSVTITLDAPVPSRDDPHKDGADVASDTTEVATNLGGVTEEDLEYGNTSRHLRSSLRPTSYPVTQTSSGLDIDYKYDKPSKLRSSLLTLVGIVLIVGGVVWAVIHVIQSPDYQTTQTGQPMGAILCSKVDQELILLQISNDNYTTASYAPQYREECQRVSERERSCSFAISYNFTVEHLDNATEIGFDTWTFDAGHECHESVPQSRQDYLQASNITIYYEYVNPSENHYHPPPTAGSIAGIIAGISCGVGILFLCTSVLECVLN